MAQPTPDTAPAPGKKDGAGDKAPGQGPGQEPGQAQGQGQGAQGDKTGDQAIAESLRARQAQLKGGVQIFLALAVMGMVFFGAWKLAGMMEDYIDEIRATPPAATTTSPATSSAPATAPAATGSTDDLRVALQSELAAAQDKMDETLDTAGLGAWQADTVAQLQAQLQRALASYGGGDFLQARQRLREWEAALESYRAEWQTAVQESHVAAVKALANGDQLNAEIHNRQTLALSPDFPDALALAERIGASDDAQNLREDLRVAQVENNLPKQRDILRRLVKLAPQDADLRARLEAVEKELQDQSFSEKIKQSQAALEAGQWDEAAAAAAQAEKIVPGRPVTAALRKQIAAERLRANTATRIAQIKKLIAQDDWQAAAKISGIGLKAAPDNRELQTLATQAAQVNNATGNVRGLNRDPARLHDLNVAAHARQTLAAAQTHAGLSATLRREIARLQANLAEAAQPLTITIESDNNTDIRVLGVGNVGKTPGRSLELKPGNYRFEGRRPGYRSKIVEVEVSKQRLPITVRVVCDEKVG